MSDNQSKQEKTEALLLALAKRAMEKEGAVDPATLQQLAGGGGAMPGGGMPMDPAMGGGGGMPMDPAMGGGGGMPMDPAMGGGGGGMPMDPAMLASLIGGSGGAEGMGAPVAPAAPAAPAGGPAGPLTEDKVRQIIQEEGKGGGGGKSSGKSSKNAQDQVMYQLKQLVLGLYKHLDLPIPDEALKTPDELEQDAETEDTQTSEATGHAPAEVTDAPPSPLGHATGIDPIQPIQPGAPGAGLQSGDAQDPVKMAQYLAVNEGGAVAPNPHTKKSAVEKGPVTKETKEASELLQRVDWFMKR